MGHAATITCTRCSQPMDASVAVCPHCGAPHQQGSGPAEVPPALAITVALGLLTGVLFLIFLVTKATAPNHHQPPPPPPPSTTAPAPVATPSVVTPPAWPSPVATPSPSPKPTPAVVLPTEPKPGEKPVKLGLPPDPPPPVGAGGEPTHAPRYPPPP